MKKKILSLIISAIILSGIFIPRAALAAETAATYTVISGDSLWKISTTFKVSVTDLKTWNGLTSDIIYVGQVLKVADVAAQTASTTPTPAPTVSTIDYTVVSGDSLWLIAQKNSTTVDNIMKLNNLTSSTIYVGQVLKVPGTAVPAPAPTVPVVQTVNYKVVSGDNLWTLAQKYGTTVDAIMKTNMLVVDYVMPNQILTIPVNSKEAVKPVGITMMSARVNDNFGDIYTWENAMRLWTVGTTGTLRDLGTGKTFNIKYYGGSNHSDIVTLTQQDTDIMKSIYGTWSWSNDHKRPMVLNFTKGGVNYQMAVSLTGMPHSTTDNYTNGMDGHCDLYFYNSVGHSDPVIDPVHQANILKASGR